MMAPQREESAVHDDDRTVRSKDYRQATLEIYVRDLARAKRFYETVLGWKFGAEVDRTLLFQYLPGLAGKVIEDPTRAGLSPQRTAVDVWDARAAAALAKDLGATIESESAGPGSVEILITDLDGAHFCLCSV